MVDARELWREVRTTDTPGTLPLGPNSFDRWVHDPKRLAFYGARYSLAAKLVQDRATIMDIGCGDGFFCPTFLTDTVAREIIGVDFDEELIGYAYDHLMPALQKARPEDAKRLHFMQADFLAGGWRPNSFEAAVSLDCIEHLDPSTNNDFITKVYDLLTPNGIAVIGTPSEHAANLGSPHSQLGHCNNFTPASLRRLMKDHFPTVILMGLNDCMVHVGHEKLWHYVVAIAVKGA